jgi:hypothetical protein
MNFAAYGTLVAMTASLGLVACGSAPPPTAKLATTSAAIRTATELHANEIPAAQLHLKYAQDQEATAKKYMADGDNEKATWLLARSEADAEVAIAIAKEQTAQAQAAKAQQEVQAIPKIPGATTPAGQ